MARPNKLNGTIKVGLGQSKSGKILDRNTKYVHFYSSNDENEQIRRLMLALQLHKESGKKIFYSHNNKAYQEITANWIGEKISELSLNN